MQVDRLTGLSRRTRCSLIVLVCTGTPVSITHHAETDAKVHRVGTMSPVQASRYPVSCLFLDKPDAASCCFASRHPTSDEQNLSSDDPAAPVSLGPQHCRPFHPSLATVLLHRRAYTCSRPRPKRRPSRRSQSMQSSVGTVPGRASCSAGSRVSASVNCQVFAL